MNKSSAFLIGLALVVLISACVQQSNQYQTKQEQQNSLYDNKCEGTAQCYNGTVTRILDGDTVEVNGDSIRLVLVDAPETYETGGAEATSFIMQNCPVGSEVLVDQDDWQLYDDYGRILAVVWCKDKRLNEESIEQGFSDIYYIFCSQSEFGDDKWAVKLGC